MKRFVTASTTIEKLLEKYPFTVTVLEEFSIPHKGKEVTDTLFSASKHAEVDVEILLEAVNSCIAKEVEDGFTSPEVTQAKPTGMDQFSMQQKRIDENLAHITHKIAVYSGKGGVGKTTVSVNLAAYLAKMGKTVCLLDADIDCPNVNKVLGITESLRVDEKRKRLIPIEKHGMKVLSMASLQQNEDTAIAWRGPMIAGAIRQFLEMTDWGNADYLIIDLPPGTSDAPMTLMQSMQLTGVIIVTTPQEVAVVDARKSANMTKKLGAQVLGVVENMAGEIFGSGGGKRVADAVDAPFLGSLSLLKGVRESSEKGIPAVLKEQEVEKAFASIVQKLGL